MMPDLAVELLVPPLMEKITAAGAERPARHRAVAGPRDLHRGIRPHHRYRDLIGNAFKGFHRQLLYTDRDALAVRRGHPVGTKLKRRDVFLKHGMSPS